MRHLLPVPALRLVAACLVWSGLISHASAHEKTTAPHFDQIWQLETPAELPRDESRLPAVLAATPARLIPSIEAGGIPIRQERWYRLRLARGAGAVEAADWLRVRAAGLREIDAYLVIDGRVVARARAGHAVPMEQKSTPTVSLGLQLRPWSGEHADVYLRIFALRNAPLMPAIFSEREFLVAANVNTAIFSGYVGALLLLLLFQASFFVVFRDAPSRDYIFFAVAILLLSLSRSGYFDHYFAGRLGGFLIGEWREHLRLLTSWLGLRTVCSYFEFSFHAPTWARWVRGFCWALLPIGLLGPAMPQAMFYGLVSLSQLIAVVLVIASCAIAISRGLVGAVLVTLSWIPIGAVTLMALNNSHPFESVDPELLTTSAVLWEMTISTVGLGYRLKRLREAHHQRELKEREASSLRRLIRVISHDVQTPLAVISFTSHLMAKAARTNGTFAMGPAASRLSEAAQAIKEIAESVRDWALLREHEEPFLLTRVEIVPLLEETLRLFEQRTAEKNITVVKQFESGALCVRGEPRLMRRSIFSNALSNAVKFTPPGGEIRLTVALSGASAEVTIEDSGKGIPPEVIAAFSDSRSLVKSAGGAGHDYGTGFGLPLMRDFTRALGGDAFVEANGEKPGTRVRLRFPLWDPAPALPTAERLPKNA